MMCRYLFVFLYTDKTNCTITINISFLRSFYYFRSSKPEQLFVDCSTISPESSKKVSDMAEQKGCKFLGAPVSGGIYIYR